MVDRKNLHLLLFVSRNPKSYMKLEVLSPVLGAVGSTGWIGAGVEGSIMHLYPFSCFLVRELSFF